jgi:hypothetical protein
MPVTFLDVKSNLRVFPYSTPVPISLMASFTVDTGATPEEYKNASDKMVSWSMEMETASQTAIAAIEAEQTTTSGDEWKRLSFNGLDGMDKLVKPLESGLKKLNAVIQVLTKILKIIELFMSAFSSFSGLVRSIIDMAQKKLNSFAEDSMTFGVYINAVAPPALLPKFSTDPDSQNQSRGGFEGFLTRLDGSINNVSDANRPPFKSQDYVGGLLFVVDTESVDEIWNGLVQLYNVFNFVGEFGISIKPPPPENIKGVCGFFQNDPNSTTAKLGIQLDWKNTFLSGGYLVYRSQVAGGVYETEQYFPTHMMDDKTTKEDGILTVVKNQISLLFGHQAPPLPTRQVLVYKDDTFNGGNPVYVRTGLTQTISFVDKFVDPTAPQYYYVIRACDSTKTLKGDYSTELAVTVKTCDDSAKFAHVIEQPGGRFELISYGGAMKVNTWSSIQINMLVPWFKEVIKIMNNMLDTVKGMCTNVSNSFSDFINQIKSKIEMFMGVIQTISMLLTSMKGLVLGPSIAMLNLKPAKGGMTTFMDRVRNATVPAGRDIVIKNPDETETVVTVPGFSGANGITVGFVIVYGGSGAVVGTVGKAMDLIRRLFAKK